MEKLLSKLFRFEIFAGVVILAVIMCIVKVHVPYADRLVRGGKELWEFCGFKQREASFVDQKKKVDRDIRLLDSLIEIQEHKTITDEKVIMGAFYQYADTAGLRTSKVEIGERMKINDHFETAVTVRGNGTYASIGRFCEAIENMPVPIRVRQISAGSPADGTIDAIIDFVVLTK